MMPKVSKSVLDVPPGRRLRFGASDGFRFHHRHDSLMLVTKHKTNGGGNCIVSDEGRLIGGRYILGDFIAAGTMGEVYRARHQLTRQEVAIKLLFPYLAKRETDVIRFKREAQLAASLDHPNIVRIFDAGIDDGRYFLAMEYLEGKSFDKVLYSGKMTRLEAVEILMSALAALKVAHRAQIVHRDIKPGNIMLCSDGDGRREVKLLDFGIARHAASERATMTGTTIGTPLYMSPEQATRPDEAENQADVWSVGVMLYEILTGFRPFSAPSPTGILLKVVSTAHVSVLHCTPDAPPELAEIIERCLKKKFELRYADAGELLTHLQKVMSDPEVRDWLERSPVTTQRTGTAPENAPTLASEDSLNALSESGLARSGSADPRRGWYFLGLTVITAIIAFLFVDREPPTPPAVDRGVSIESSAPSVGLEPLQVGLDAALIEDAQPVDASSSDVEPKQQAGRPNNRRSQSRVSRKIRAQSTPAARVTTPIEKSGDSVVDADLRSETLAVDASRPSAEPIVDAGAPKRTTVERPVPLPQVTPDSNPAAGSGKGEAGADDEIDEEVPLTF